MGARIRPGGSAVNRHETGTRDRESCREISLAQHGGPDGRRWGAPEIRFALDSPLEGRVSCELVSEKAKFPGNFIDSGLGGASEEAKKGMKSVSYGPIPYAS
jgi:hypothetical protein